MIDPINTLAAGVLLILSGMSGLLRHFLFEPQMTNYPKTRPWLMWVYFGFASSLLYLGLRYVTIFFTDKTQTIPPQAGGVMVFLAFVITVYKFAMLANTLTQRFPSAVWARNDRWWDVVRCSRDD